MRIVVGLGGSVLLKRGAAPTVENQRANIRVAVSSLVELFNAGHELIITYGNGPQANLLAIDKGITGYLIEQELRSAFREDIQVAILLTQVVVDADDPALQHSTDGRRTVPSPVPHEILGADILKLLYSLGVLVICVGGGGIPVVRNDDGTYTGADGVIDKDTVAALLAETIGVDMLLLLTDVDGVFENWGTDQSQLVREADPQLLTRSVFTEGSMRPKVQAACSFADKPGRSAAIGIVGQALAVVEGRAGTLIRQKALPQKIN